MAEKASMLERLSSIQAELKVPKDLNNEFGGYKYRNAEQILAELHPICRKFGCTVTLDDDVVFIEGRFYIKSVARLSNYDGECIEATGWAREQESKTKSDPAQITGMASSYARKYALGALFAIDDGRDFDSLDNTGEKPKGTPVSTQKRTEPADAYMEAKYRLWRSVKAYCAKNGGDPKETFALVFEASDFENTADHLNMVAGEYERMMQ